MVDKVVSLQRKLTENQQVVLECLETAKKMDYDKIFIIGVKDECEWLHHNGYETLEMVGRLEGIKYQLWSESHLE